MQYLIIASALTLLTLTRAHPSQAHPRLLTPRAPTINCNTNDASPAVSDLRSLGKFSPFADTRGDCLASAMLCPGQFNNWCIATTHLKEKELAHKGNLFVTVTGYVEQMQIMCADLQHGIEELVKRCEKNGKVEGSVEFGTGKGHFTVEVKGPTKN